MSYTQHATHIRISRRRPTLVPESSSRSLARRSRFPQLPALPLCPRAVSGLSDRRSAPQLRFVQSRKRTAFYALRSPGTGARGAALFGQRSCSTGTTAGSCSALSQGAQATADEVAKKRLRLAIWGEPENHKSVLPTWSLGSKIGRAHV